MEIKIRSSLSVAFTDRIKELTSTLSIVGCVL